MIQQNPLTLHKVLFLVVTTEVTAFIKMYRPGAGVWLCSRMCSTFSGVGNTMLVWWLNLTKISAIALKSLEFS